jgi:uncharacterized membrane protein
VRLLPASWIKSFLSVDEQQRVVNAIKEAERQTSGEIRLFIETRCRFVDPLDRAAELFFGLKMDATEQRNATLIYVAVRDRQYAIFGDDGIHQKVGTDFWQAMGRQLAPHFQNKHFDDGLIAVIAGIGAALKAHFPYDRDTDKNELPDEIVFGK